MGWRAIRLAGATAAALLCLASPASGQKRSPPDPYGKALAGGYELSTNDGARRCLILLRPEDGGRRAVGFPPPCRRSFPVLSEVAGWRAAPGDDGAALRLVLTGAGGSDRLAFSLAAKADMLTADDGSHHLKPMAGPSLAQRVGAAASVKAEQDRVRAPVPASDGAAMQSQSGTYRLLRLNGRDSGCRIGLLPAKDSEGEARLEPGCGDHGATFFAPARWRIAAGTLWLSGPRGKLSFERNRKGQWDKGPGQGEALTLARP